MAEAIAAGHICLDIIPDLSFHPAGQFEAAFLPGRLVQTGPATICTGGSVSNTGLALHRLGIDTRLIARIGPDVLGKTLLHILYAYSPDLVEGIRTSTASSTSYSVVISPTGSDRTFLHHPGANDDFSQTDVQEASLVDARLFHFGYPPIMAQMYAQDGRQLASLFQWVKSLGLTTSLDMAYPDLDSPGGQANWRKILQSTLPHVDIFLPSLDEIQFMLRRPFNPALSPALLEDVSAELLSFGAKIVVLKLGERGLYLRAASGQVLLGLGKACPDNWRAWAGFEAWQPCFQVEVAGTTGSGDATIAGFLTAFIRGLPPDQALEAALAVGACNVEAADAISGLRSWPDTLQRIRAGWKRKAEPQAFQRLRNW
jgi:sugar/nucleoside kinase (ribokinase family)